MTKLLAVSACVFLCATAAVADSGAARDVTPTDGILCCFAPTFSFDDEGGVLIPTGRAGVFHSENSGERWTRAMRGLVGPDGVEPYVYQTCAAPSSPGTLYAVAGISTDSTYPGIFRSEDLGKHWVRKGLVPNLNAGDCAVDPVDANTVYVLTDDLVASSPAVLWKSTDGADTFKRIGGLPPLEFFSFVRIGAGGTVYVADFGTSAGLYASTDGGATFVRKPSAPADPLAMFPHPTEPGILYLQTPAGLFRSSDAGDSFAPVAGGVPTALANSVAFDPNDPDTVYVGAFSAGLFKSTDGGTTFAQVRLSSGPPTRAQAVIVVGVNQRSVFVSTYGGLMRSDDGGTTFRFIMNGFRASTVNDLSVDASGRLLVDVYRTAGVFRQKGQAGDYESLGDNLPPGDHNFVSVAASPTDPDVLLLLPNVGPMLRTGNAGQSWLPATVTGFSTFPFLGTRNRVRFASSSRAYVAGYTQPGLFRSDDAGKTFTRNSPKLRLLSIAGQPGSPDVLYVGAIGPGIHKSVDGGTTLRSLGQPGRFSALLVDQRNPQAVYAGLEFSGVVLRSLDGGATFAPASTGLAGTGVLGLAQDSRGTLFAWMKRGGLFRSDDGAATWTAVGDGESLRRSGVEAGRAGMVVDPLRPGRVYLGNSGVIRVDTDDDDESGDR